VVTDSPVHHLDGGHDDEIRGLDNIALDLRPAGVGSRILAGLLDYLLLFLILSVVIGMLVLLGIALAPVVDPSRDTFVFVVLVVVFILIPFLVNWGYFIFLEISGNGQTPGKRQAKIRVVGRLGGTASTRSIVIRNLLRDIDLIIGVPLMATDGRCRRLGDRLAGTLVVHEAASSKETTERRMGRMPASWGASQVAVVEALFERAGELESEHVQRLGRRLVALVQRDAPELLDEPARSRPEADPNPLRTLREALQLELVRTGVDEPWQKPAASGTASSGTEEPAAMAGPQDSPAEPPEPKPAESSGDSPAGEIRS
jgi:uncharacterized RDD family membrane protein YckC